MNYRALIVLLLAAILLVGCSMEGPSVAEAEGVIYGVYIREARILERRQCELTSWMEEEGYANVWLVRYRFEGSDSEGGMLLTETDSQEYPWEILLRGVEACPSE